ncbi:MAG: PKD domain-containing protein [Candidatus Doudnabacteria bacterium]|nr:PKD domain-containing protein [Candidatus Doudnabacteria bacterium]
MKQFSIAALLFALMLGVGLTPVGAQADACIDDINQDGAVDLSDVNAINSALLQPASVRPRADFDGNGLIDLQDYHTFTSNLLNGILNCKPTEPTINNLLRNPSFESGSTNWNLATAQLTTEDKQNGANSLKYTKGGDPFQQGGISVTPGKTYMFTGWFKWVEYSGTEWGYSIMAIDQPDNKKFEMINMQEDYEPNKWHKIAMTIVPTTNQVAVRAGMFGPKSVAKLYFDNFAFFEKATNIAPTVNPSANVTSGNAPLTVNFIANATDADSAITVYDWEFGDGSKGRNDTETHTFITPGNYKVSFTAVDTEGASSTKEINISVGNPTGRVTVISQGERVETANSSFALSGNSTSDSNITSVVWDNVNTFDGGVIQPTAAKSVGWQTPAIALKPGNNEILVTSTDVNGFVSTDKIDVYRTNPKPTFSQISLDKTQLPKLDKIEITFQLATVANEYMFRYDANPPAGVKPGTGVTVEARITQPDGQTVVQPAFFMEQTAMSMVRTGYYVLTGQTSWKVRYSPSQVGNYSVRLFAQDASGTNEVSAGTFVVTDSSAKGFIQVSQADTRYFEYQNGELYWPIGTVVDRKTNIPGTTNLVRTWLGGLGIYSTNWARWKSSAEAHGNEGVKEHLNFLEAYPSSELSHDLFYPQGARIWMTYWNDDNFGHIFKNNTEYQLKIRLKTVGLSGPRTAGQPWGLTIKRHGWTGLENPAPDLTSKPAIFPHIQTTRDWHTVIARFNTGSTGRSDDDFSIYLENVTGGQAYVDELSIREVLSGGALGAELVRNPKADMHKYVEQRPAAFLDDQINLAKQNGFNYVLVVRDKNDWIPGHLSPYGRFVASGGGYYQPKGTKSRWLEEQWWRYLAARWGYSQNIFSWELNNEGPPDEDASGSHARMTQDFAAFFKANDAHKHLATTSFWCCWKPNLWKDKVNLPDIGYADVHEYTNGSSALEQDVVYWHMQLADQVARDNVGRPVIRGEAGINGSQMFNLLSQTNSGLWYHHLNWVQLNSAGLMDPLYWHTEHLNVIDFKKIAGNFHKFVSTLDINKGGYSDIAATSTSSQILVFGQKNTSKRKAYAWIQNKANTWYARHQNQSIPAQSGQVSISMPAGSYKVEWWDTYSGTVSSSQTLSTNSESKLVLNISNLGSDIAIKISQN